MPQSNRVPPGNDFQTCLDLNGCCRSILGVNMRCFPSSYDNFERETMMLDQWNPMSLVFLSLSLNFQSKSHDKLYVASRWRRSGKIAPHAMCEPKNQRQISQKNVHLAADRSEHSSTLPAFSRLEKHLAEQIVGDSVYSKMIVVGWNLAIEEHRTSSSKQLRTFN